MNQMVNNIQVTRNLIYMLKTWKTYNPTIKFSKYIVMLIFLMWIVAKFCPATT